MINFDLLDCLIDCLIDEKQVKSPGHAQGRKWWALEVDAHPRSALVVSVFRHGTAGDQSVQLNAGRTRGAAEYRLPQGQYMVRTSWGLCRWARDAAHFIPGWGQSVCYVC